MLYHFGASERHFSALARFGARQARLKGRWPPYDLYIYREWQMRDSTPNGGARWCSPQQQPQQNDETTLKLYCLEPWTHTARRTGEPYMHNTLKWLLLRSNVRGPRLPNPMSWCYVFLTGDFVLNCAKLQYMWANTLIPLETSCCPWHVEQSSFSHVAIDLLVDTSLEVGKPPAHSSED